MLRTETATKRFHQKHGTVTALDSVSITIGKGEFVAITGPSGSGKSTLLLMLGGMSTPTQGKVVWESGSMYDWSGKQRAQWRAAKVGYVFQSFNLVPYLTVGENVAIGLRLSGVTSNGKDRCSRAIEEVRLTDRVHHLPSELSVGQQQRVALARALVKNPELILADEPTGNLDPATAAEVMDVLCRLNNEGKTVVIITHDPAIAAKAHRIVRIADGKIAV